MTKANTIEKKTETNNTKKVESAEVIALRKELEELKVEASTKEALEAELKLLKDTKNRTGGKPIVLDKAMYEFRNIEDPGQNFNGTFSWPIIEGGSNHRTSYSFDDGAQVELPLIYAKQLNACKYPKNKLALDAHGNKLIQKGVHVRWVFSKVE